MVTRRTPPETCTSKTSTSGSWVTTSRSTSCATDGRSLGLATAAPFCLGESDGIRCPPNEKAGLKPALLALLDFRPKRSADQQNSRGDVLDLRRLSPRAGASPGRR